MGAFFNARFAMRNSQSRDRKYKTFGAYSAPKSNKNDYVYAAFP